jgi:hypothetical protein
VSDYALDLDYLTLDEALDTDAIDVVELDRDGSVPELKPETFQKVFDKLVESYSLDAIDTPEAKTDSQVETGRVREFMQSAAACNLKPRPSVGLGTDCRLESNTITGFALAHDNQILHLSAFSKTGTEDKEKPFTRMMRASHRRRFRR